MKKGIVMEVNKRFLTILTPEGEFLRAPNQNTGCQIGQEISFIPINMEESKYPFNLLTKRKWILSAVMAGLLFLMTSVSYFQTNQVYAYLSIDINPSMELAVNKNFEVLEIIPYNDDAKQIISQLSDWKKENIQEVTESIMTEIKKQGYLEENKEVVISKVDLKGKNDDRVKQWDKEIQEIRSIVENENITLDVVEGTKEEREKALKEGVTTGLYKENKMKMVDDNKINQDESENPSTQKNIPITPVEVPSNNKQEDKGKSESAPGQIKKAEETNKGDNNPIESDSNRKQNGNSVTKDEKQTGQDKKEVPESNGNNKDKQKDKNPNINKEHPSNKNKQNGEKNNKHNE